MLFFDPLGPQDMSAIHTMFVISSLDATTSTLSVHRLRQQHLLCYTVPMNVA